MTRAEDHLILTYTRGKRAPANWARMVEDRVTREVDADPPPPDSLARPEAVLQIEPISRPAAGDRDETAVTVTSLAVFASCPRKYFLQRYIGWSAEPSGDGEQNEANPEISAADLGSAVHAVLAGKPGPHPPEAHELAQVFLQNELGRRAAASPRSAREWDFVVEAEGVILRGSVDLWFEDAGELHIVDYKTDSVIRPGEYGSQLALYALAMERAFGKRPFRASLHFLRHDAIEEVRIDDDAIRDARELIARLRKAQNSLTFDLNEGPHCRSCPYFRSQCPAG